VEFREELVYLLGQACEIAVAVGEAIEVNLGDISSVL
jgi:hypothetical protein